MDRRHRGLAGLRRDRVPVRRGDYRQPLPRLAGEPVGRHSFNLIDAAAAWVPPRVQIPGTGRGACHQPHAVEGFRLRPESPDQLCPRLEPSGQVPVRGVRGLRRGRRGHAGPPVAVPARGLDRTRGLCGVAALRWARGGRNLPHQVSMFTPISQSVTPKLGCCKVQLRWW